MDALRRTMLLTQRENYRVRALHAIEDVMRDLTRAAKAVEAGKPTTMGVGPAQRMLEAIGAYDAAVELVTIATDKETGT